jgi:hypothetical protein
LGMVLSQLLLGCAIRWTKTPWSETQYKEDDYACTRASQKKFYNPNRRVYEPGVDLALYVQCMESKGYSQARD